jgi:tRNA pseudouridine38-40 synthase
VRSEQVRLRLGIAYDGTDFAGWAKQPGLRTVQGELESALALVLRATEPVRIAVAGRTDAGVHARGQVAHADVERDRWEALASRGADLPVRRLGGVLAADVRVHEIGIAPEGFEARWSALSRSYAYRVSDVPGGSDPLLRSHVLHHTGPHNTPLDVEAMNAAAEALLGEHDFASFCRRRAGASTVRSVFELRWEREPESGLVVMHVRADAFCHSMVRALVGVLLPVGDGRRPVDWPRTVLARTRREPDAEVAPPTGLCLERVEYPADDKLAAQAESARRFRGDDILAGRDVGQDPDSTD